MAIGPGKSKDLEPTLIADPIASRIPFFYGWVMLPIVLLIHVATSPGQTYGVSVFNPHIRNDLGLSQSEIGGAYMCGTLLASLPMIYVGTLMDRYGPRRILTGVVILFGLTCGAMSQATGLVTVFLSFLFLRMLGGGSMNLLAANTMALWFNRKLGFAVGMVSVGSALSMGIIPSANLWLIQSFGWRGAYAILGILVVGMVLPLLAFLFRNRPEDVGQAPDGREMEPLTPPHPDHTVSEKAHELGFAIRTRAYWILAASVFMPALTVTGIHFHAVQIYLDVGLAEADAAHMFSIFAVAVALSMLVGGIMADRFQLNRLLSASMVGISSGIWLLTYVSSPWSSRLFAVVLGAGLGVFMSVLSTILARYYGRAHLGKIRGTVITIEIAASSTGPFLMGVAHDILGSYNSILTAAALVTAPMVFIALFATPPGERRDEPESYRFLA